MQAQIKQSYTTSPRVDMRDASHSPSPWLYLAGLLVTWSGLYAVNYGLADTDFATMTYVLAASGYLISYVLRWRGVSTRALQTPLIVCLGLALFALYSSDGGFALLMPEGTAHDRAKTMQMVFAWMGILHAFVLTSDAAVLFACVPCMTMLALVSTLNGDAPIQNAFLVFIAAATFLMVHENYLRTRAGMTGKMSAQTIQRDKKFFNAQIALVGICIGGALLLANLVVIPVRSVGQTLSDLGAYQTLTQSAQQKQTKQNFAPVTVSENNSVQLATGGGPESDTPLLRIKSDRGLYWRGTTFATYNGHSFSNPKEDEQNLMPSDAEKKPDLNDLLTYREAANPDAEREKNRFEMPQSPFELKPSEMQGSTSARQEVTVVAGMFNQLYGAGNILKVETPPRLSTLHTDQEGSIKTADAVPLDITYVVTSQVASDEPDALRAAPSGKAALPPLIARAYLQTAPEGQPENATLRGIVQDVTKGLTNNYDKAQALERYIGDQCRYNLKAAAAPAAQDVVEYFLTQSREGYCDSFGAAMTMLCRYAGIPARLASGFLYGDVQPDGTYIVREKHKHIWAEVFFPKIGWIPFDATEMAQDVTPHDAAKKKDKTLGSWLQSHGVLPPLVVGTILALLLYVFKTEVLDKRKPRKVPAGAARPVNAPTNREVLAIYQSATNLMARRGLKRLPHVTPDEFVQQVAVRCKDCSPRVSILLQQLTDRATFCRYSGEIATPDDVQQVKTLLADLKQDMARIKRNDMKPPLPAGGKTLSAQGAAWR